MLKYRRYNPKDRIEPLTIHETMIPEYLKSEIDEETDKMIKEQLEIEEKLLNIKLRFHHED